MDGSGPGNGDTVENETTLDHEHDWHLVSVDYEGESPIREFLCASCPEVWFAS